MNFDDTPIYSLEQLKPILVAIKGKLTSNFELIHSMDIVPAQPNLTKLT